jgi:hypothetical protein
MNTYFASHDRQNPPPVLKRATDIRLDRDAFLRGNAIPDFKRALKYKPHFPEHWARTYKARSALCPTRGKRARVLTRHSPGGWASSAIFTRTSSAGPTRRASRAAHTSISGTSGSSIAGCAPGCPF